VAGQLGAVFPRHNAAGVRTRCAEAGKVRRAHLCHLCQRCAALPEDQRPPEPRPVATKPGARLVLCASHLRAHKEAQRQARNAAARERRGITEVERGQLWETQGRVCGICLVPLNIERKAPELDHDHDRAAQHDHPVDQVCRACARGLLCRTCNLHVVGRMDPAALHRALAWLAGINPAARLGWWSTDPDTETEEPTTCLVESPRR
jgi:hypothetical protein